MNLGNFIENLLRQRGQKAFLHKKIDPIKKEVLHFISVSKDTVDLSKCKPKNYNHAYSKMKDLEFALSEVTKNYPLDDSILELETCFNAFEIAFMEMSCPAED